MPVSSISSLIPFLQRVATARSGPINHSGMFLQQLYAGSTKNDDRYPGLSVRRFEHEAMSLESISVFVMQCCPHSGIALEPPTFPPTKKSLRKGTLPLS
jgi:hypothetical protein